MVLCRRLGIVASRNVHNGVLSQVPEEVALENIRCGMRPQKLERQHALDASNIGAANIALSPPHRTAFHGERAQYRLDQSLAEHARDAVIVLEDFVGGI